MVAVSGESQRGGPKGWILQPRAHLGPHRHLLWGHPSWMMSTYLPAAPWTLELSPEQGGALQKGPSFHQPPCVHPIFSSQKTPQQASGSRESPGLASANHGSALTAVTWPESPWLGVSVFMCLISVLIPTPTPFARALLEPFCPFVDCTPPRHPPGPRACGLALSAPFPGTVGHSFPASVILGRSFHFLEKIQGPRWAECPGPSLQAA